MMPGRSLAGMMTMMRPLLGSSAGLVHRDYSLIGIYLRVLELRTILVNVRQKRTEEKARENVRMVLYRPGASNVRRTAAIKSLALRMIEKFLGSIARTNRVIWMKGNLDD